MTVLTDDCNQKTLAIIEEYHPVCGHEYLDLEPHSLAVASKDSRSSSLPAERSTLLPSLSLDTVNINTIATCDRSSIRRLTVSMAVSAIDMSVDMIPGSPPDLTNSKSSKSSSLRSSTLLESSAASDVSNFEDITLEDVQKAAGQHLFDLQCTDARSLTKAKSQRPSATPVGGNRNNTQSLASLRDLVNTGRPRYPTLKHQVSGALKENRDCASLNLPSSARPMRRGFTSPSAPFLPSSARSSQRSRSPSPTTRSNGWPSPHPGLRKSTDGSPTSRIPGRRQSWQPGRKTVKELEDEYHDSDDDVPEDAVIWNVPISPQLTKERSNSSSPERPSRSADVGLGATDYKAETKRSSAPAVLSESPTKSSTTAQRPKVPSSASTTAVPDITSSPRFRHSSWTAVLSDLSEEARMLTVALEAHAEETERKQEYGTAKLGVPSRPTLEKQRAKTSVVELPPVRKGNIMIDPLPISKEKEKVLTRTRPSWLPPKSQKEEKKHLKEYQRMMAHAMEAEKKRDEKIRQEIEVKKETQLSISRIWDQHVLPNWDAVIAEPRTRELWWRGVVPRSRGVVWQRAIGNELHLTADSYKVALERAWQLDRRLVNLTIEERKKHKECLWFDAIRRDVSQTYPELRIFQQDGPLNDALLDVLMAYSVYRSDVGYVYGTHLVAALLLLNLTPSATFISLANLFNRSVPMAFLIHDTGAMSRAHDLVLSTLRYKLPRLHKHLTQTIDLSPQEYLDPMFRTLFCRGLGVDLASRVWDVYVFEGDKVLVRTAVGILASLEAKLYGSRGEVLDLLGWGGGIGWELESEDAFMKKVRSMGKTEGKGEL